MDVVHCTNITHNDKTLTIIFRSQELYYEENLKLTDTSFVLYIIILTT